MKKHLTLLGVAAMATAVLAGCSNDEIVESYQGEEISFRTRIETRAQEIETTADLPKFHVWGDAYGYDKFFLANGIAEHTSNGNYKLTTQEGNKVYWPSGISRIDFWAYGPYDINVTPVVNSTQKRLNNYAPKSELTEGGKSHEDLVIAHTTANHNDEGTSVTLKFEHALSDINLQLKSGDESKFMRLKGAWFVNAQGTGDVYYSDEKMINWSESSNDATYGVQFSDAVQLKTNALPVITKTDKTDLMLIPQNRKKLEFNADHTIKTDGSYILLLCQILSQHAGIYHSGDETTVDDANAVHYHQLFPEKDEVLTKFTEEYAYSCVPVDFNWISGMRYIYSLEFCGANSGGGIYPPDVLPSGLPPVDGITVISKPEGKHQGEPVLDNPISFDVSIAGWADANLPDVPMN